MGKTPADTLLDEIAGDFHTYLRKGVRFDRVIGAAHADLDIDDIETLLRVHFVLTDAEEDDSEVGVLDFVRQLETRIRRMTTATASRSVEHRGEVRGRLDWSQTVETRARAGQFDQPLFVCKRAEEQYDIPENLVLKRLLSVVHEILTEDLAELVGNLEAYGWLDRWTDPGEITTGRREESAVELLDRVYEENVYLQRIDVGEGELTARTVESVKRSRSRFYREAATLLDRYRRLQAQDLDAEEARELLDHTLVAPEQTDVLFELYWVFQVLDQFEGVQYRVLADERERPSVIAEWERDGERFVLSHDATGEQLTFAESPPENVEPDGYLFRSTEVLSRWDELSAEFLGRDSEGSLWGGRPDIVLERYAEADADGWDIDQVFIGEVKYTQDTDYVATGLRELLEYMAFVKDSATGKYVEASDDVLDSVAVMGALFVDELAREGVETESGEVDLVQYPQSPGEIL